jgi:hypothetical protein
LCATIADGRATFATSETKAVAGKLRRYGFIETPTLRDGAHRTIAGDVREREPL